MCSAHRPAVLDSFNIIVFDLKVYLFLFASCILYLFLVLILGTVGDTFTNEKVCDRILVFGYFV